MQRNEDTGPVQWDDNGPARSQKWIPVVSPKPHQNLKLLITSDRWKGVYTHYFDERTRPCTGNELNCDGCYRKLAKRWKAYLCGAILPYGKMVIVELTQGAMQGCPEIIDRTTHLRGRVLEMWRAGTSKTSPVKVKLQPMQSNLFVPDAFNLMEALCVIWGIKYEPFPADVIGDTTIG